MDRFELNKHLGFLAKAGPYASVFVCEADDGALRYVRAFDCVSDPAILKKCDEMLGPIVAIL